MAGRVHVIESREVWLGEYRLSDQTTSNAEAWEVAELDGRAYGDSFMVKEPGLKGGGIAGTGLWRGGANRIDDAIFGKQRVSGLPLALALTDGSVGSPARFFRSMVTQYTISGDHGERTEIDYASAISDRPLRGTILRNSSSSGNVTGTVIRLGAVAAGQRVYAALHVFSGSGNLDVALRSDNTQGFGSPTLRIGFSRVASATPRASEWGTPVGGVIADQWWRVTATNPGTRDFAVVVAIR